MKSTITTLSLLLISITVGWAQADLLGDNFSLENALEIFKESKDLEAYEASLNSQTGEINNLDLNEDGQVDYITVTDHHEGDVHAIVLSALISEDESQDIAVIEIEKTGDSQATLQIVGDEDLYGADMIIEPTDTEVSSTGSGPDGGYEVSRIVVNVWYWPSVRWIYHPGYRLYRSPWRWGYYPSRYRVWRPVRWSIWSPLRARYAPRYRVAPVRRVATARTVYRPHRRHSVSVTKRHSVKVTKARNKTSVTRTSTKRVKTKNGRVKSTRKTKTTKIKKGNKSTKVKKAKKVKKKN